MRVEKQTEVLRRVELPEVRAPPARHSRLFPSTVRCILAGPSGSGKTDLLLTLLLDQNGLRFENVYICARTLYQEKYKLLEEVFRNLPEIGFFMYDNVDAIDLKEIKPNSVVIFDDVITSKQNTIRDIFSFGRHKCIDVIYLVQTLTKVPKHLIRDNANMFVLFRQDMRNIRNFYNDNISTDLKFEEFLKMCSLCWNNCKHGYVVINLECDKKNGRYRQGFDNYIIYD